MRTDDHMSREALAWADLCEQVYTCGLRVVPPSEGGVHPAWLIDGDTWSTVVVVEPVEHRPDTYKATEPWQAIAGRMLRRDSYTVGELAELFGVDRRSIERLREDR
jgi:hypothetical protein